MILTKKLSKFEKEANKTRRHVLVEVKRLLKDKRVNVNFSVEHIIGHAEQNKVFYTGEHVVRLDWWAKVK